jgi:hypothetical protein
MYTAEKQVMMVVMKGARCNIVTSHNPLQWPTNSIHPKTPASKAKS